MEKLTKPVIVENNSSAVPKLFELFDASILYLKYNYRWNWLNGANTILSFHLKWMGNERPNGNYIERIKYETWLRKNAPNQIVFRLQSQGALKFICIGRKRIRKNSNICNYIYIFIS